MSKLLQFVDKNNPILRETIPEVRDFKDPALHETINDMCYSILPKQLSEAKSEESSAAGMAANQWGIKKRVFVFTPDGSEKGKPMEVMINPDYVPYLRFGEKQPEMVAGFEGCFSIPLATGVVNRYEAIMATYYNPQGEKIERIMEGWEARVFQHETDHLNGKLYDGQCDNFPGPECFQRFIFKDKNEMEQFWVKLAEGEMPSRS